MKNNENNSIDYTIVNKPVSVNFICPHCFNDNEDNGKFYQTTYSEGATEMQDERHLEYDDEITCTEVELEEVMMKELVPVE